MNVNILKRIININVISFFFGWVIILFLGSDKPPPMGFIWIVLLILLLDIIQYFYLKKFLPKLKNKSKGLFIKNLLFFLVGGIVVSLLTIFIDLKLFFNMGFINVLIWVFIIITVGILYGICFYIFNTILINFISEN
ncbi:MAG: hypothetical protein FH753_01985 [Firmicutes bacterium]|nr:hypothetical protein [Bacillota bacterium]